MTEENPPKDKPTAPRLQSRLQWQLERLGHFAVDVVYDRRKGRGARILAGVLRAFSTLFEAVVRTRFYLYRKRIFRAQPLGCFVVVVGNLTVGGTGKTPIVEKFARSLQQQGRKVAILSRGYKSKKEPRWRRFVRWITHAPEPDPKVVSDGKSVLLSSLEAGDEPYMLARNLPGVPVVVDKNRVKAGNYAIRHFGADILLLDDGFQYLPLRGSLNLLLVDKQNPFGNHNLLPRGILREPIEHLRRADYVFLTKSDGQLDADLEALIRRYQPEGDFIECAHHPKYLQRHGPGQVQEPLEMLRGQRVAAFSGIAVPEGFENFLRDLGAQLVCNRRFIDHHRYTEEELHAFFAEAQEARASLVVTTEKDDVRIAQDFDGGLPFYYMRLEVDILRGASGFEEAVSRLCFPKTPMRATRSPFGKAG